MVESGEVDFSRALTYSSACSKTNRFGQHSKRVERCGSINLYSMYWRGCHWCGCLISRGEAGYCLQLWKSGWRPLAAQTITWRLPRRIRTRRESWRPRPSNSKQQYQRSVPMKTPRGFGGEH